MKKYIKSIGVMYIVQVPSRREQDQLPARLRLTRLMWRTDWRPG